MQPSQDATVFIVDDDAGVRDALSWLLRSRGLYSETFESADAFFEHKLSLGFLPRQACCLLLDVRMPGMSGMALFENVVAQRLTDALPVIFLTGHADLPTAVEAVKRGAFDFCQKPFSDNALVDRIEQALNQSREKLQQIGERVGMQAKLAELTDRERHVMQLVVDGLPNKLIADQLAISVRTVEVHRARVFEKMDVKSAVELANLLRNM